jgi:hypothetical protein
MKMSFSEAEATDALENPAQQPTTAMVPAAPAPAAPTPYAPPAAHYVADEDGEGEFSSRDMKFPRINIAQKTGELSDEFSYGAVVLNKAIALGNFEKAVENVVVLQIQKLYQEYVPYGSGVMPRLFRTATEVHEAGLSLEWGAAKRANEILNVVFWIPQPEAGKDDHVFPFEGPVGNGVLAKFTAASTAYSTIGKTLIQAKKTFCAPDKGGMVSMTWTLHVTSEKKNGNSWALPHLRPIGKTPEALAQFLRDLKSA